MGDETIKYIFYTTLHISRMIGKDLLILVYQIRPKDKKLRQPELGKFNVLFSGNNKVLRPIYSLLRDVKKQSNRLVITLPCRTKTRPSLTIINYCKFQQ